MSGRTSPRAVRRTFADVPGWAEDDHAAALDTISRSAALGHGGFTPARLRTLAAVSRSDRAAARDFFERQFAPWCMPETPDTGFVTGYYEPEVDARSTPGGAFTVPLYRRPPDLVNLVGDAARGAGDGALTHALQTDAGTVPYATRAEIEAGALAGRGLELAYVADPIDAFFLQVQGSGVLRMTDGRRLRVAYDGKNGHPYTSIGRSLVEAGAISAAEMSLETLANWLRTDPARGRAVMHRNKSYVFFKALDPATHDGPVGVHAIPLTPRRSLAVDPRHHVIGTPIYVIAETLTHAGDAAGWRRLMITQDVGSAITGPERGDIFFGTGAAAGAIAGITKHAARFISLRPIDSEPSP